MTLRDTPVTVAPISRSAVAGMSTSPLLHKSRVYCNRMSAVLEIGATHPDNYGQPNSFVVKFRPIFR